MRAVSWDTGAGHFWRQRPVGTTLGFLKATKEVLSEKLIVSLCQKMLTTISILCEFWKELRGSGVPGPGPGLATSLCGTWSQLLLAPAALFGMREFGGVVSRAGQLQVLRFDDKG